MRGGEQKMILKTIFAILERQARKSGGDRYKDVDSGFTIYIPQSISRPSGKPLARIIVEFKKED